jgi:hypothetical protein
MVGSDLSQSTLDEVKFIGTAEVPELNTFLLSFALRQIRARDNPIA